MTIRRQLTDALDGREPSTTPLSAYHFFFGDDYAQCFDLGMGVTWHVPTVKQVRHGTEIEWEKRDEGGHVRSIERWKTPVGTVSRSRLDGWWQDHFVKSTADYDVLRWIVEHTELEPSYEGFLARDDELGENGMALVAAGRTPAMTINVDWAGTERFCLDVAMEVEELFALYEAMRRQFVEETRIIAAGPGRYVKWLENLTISMLGPRRYGELLVTVYDECAPILHAADKRVMVHYDGALRVIADRIAAAPFDAVESLTEPPEGDMTYDECRAAWPDKAFWANVNVALFSLPPERLAAEIVAKRERAGKRGLAFEISEDLPANWRKCVPVIVKTLEELG